MIQSLIINDLYLYKLKIKTLIHVHDVLFLLNIINIYISLQIRLTNSLIVSIKFSFYIRD